MCAARAASGGRVDHKRQAKAVSQTLNHSNAGNFRIRLFSCGTSFDVNKVGRVDKSRKGLCPTCFNFSMTEQSLSKKEKPLAIARRAAFRCTVWIDLGAVSFGKKVSQ